MTNKITIQTVAVVDDAINSLNRVNQSVSQIGTTSTDTSKQTNAAMQSLKSMAVVGFGALVTGATAAVKSAAELQTSMTSIAALTDTPRSAIQGLTKDVIAMSQEMPISAQELAKGLYFISSSGFKGAQAIDILRSSAKAAAAGLGETKTIADAVTSALNAYGLQGEDSARITDILTQAVREGKGEPDQLAGALGRVLPIAAAAGVSMEQVAASMATMTLTGLNADEAATALRGTIGALLAPSKEAKDALLGLGFTTDDLRAAIKDKGLLDVLKMLMERTGGNVEELDKIIPNVRALTGVLSTAKSQGDKYAEVLLKMQNAAGTTDKAFAEMSNTFEFKLKKSQNAIENLGIAVGNKLLPPLGDAADAAAVLISWQDKLDAAFKNTSREILNNAQTYDEYRSSTLAVAQAAGQVTFAFKDGSGYIDTYGKQIEFLTQAQFEAAQGLEYVDAGARGLSTQLQTLTQSNKDTEFQALATAAQLKAEAKATKEANDAAAEATIANYNLITSFKDFSAMEGAKQTISDLEAMIKENPESRDKYAAQIRAISQAAGITTPAMEAAAASFKTLEGLWMSGALTTDSYNAAMGRIQKAAADGKVSVDELGLKTGEAAAYMTSSATTAQAAQASIVNDARTNKEKMLDEMGNALEGQQTKLQTKISSSMISVSNSLTVAKSLANISADEIKAAWDRIPTKVTTTYEVVTVGHIPDTTGKGYASGGDFIVPPGYPNDSYPMRVQSGERVIVQTPAQQQAQRINQMTMNVYTQSAPNVIDEFGMMRAMLGA